MPNAVPRLGPNSSRMADGGCYLAAAGCLRRETCNDGDVNQSEVTCLEGRCGFVKNAARSVE